MYFEVPNNSDDLYKRDKNHYVEQFSRKQFNCLIASGIPPAIREELLQSVSNLSIADSNLEVSGESKISKKWGDPKIQICLKLSKIRNIWFVEKPNIIMSWKINKRSSFSYSESENTSYCWQGLAAWELCRKYSRLPITVFKSSVLYYYTRVHWPGGKWCEKRIGLDWHSTLCLPNVRNMM